MKKLVLAALLLAACNPSGPDGIEVRVPENQDFIAPGPLDHVTVRYTATNTDDSPVGVFAGCGVQIQKRSGGEWNTLTPAGLTCLPSPPRMIDPGGSVTDSVTVQGAGTWRVLVSWTGALGRSGTAESRAFETGPARL